MNLPFFSHITQICNIFQLWCACTADMEEAVIMSRAPEVARATTPSLNENIAVLCFSVIWLLIIQSSNKPVIKPDRHPRHCHARFQSLKELLSNFFCFCILFKLAFHKMVQIYIWIQDFCTGLKTSLTAIYHVRVPTKYDSKHFFVIACCPGFALSLHQEVLQLME